MAKDAIFLAALLVGVPVQAQVTSVTAVASITATYRPDVEGVPIVEVFQGTTLGGLGGSAPFGAGSTYQSTSRVDPDAIYFKNVNAAAGRQVTVDSFTVVDIGFRNSGPTAVRARIDSTILPAGLGFYVGPNCLNNVGSCGPGTPVVTPRPFDFFNPSVDGNNAIAGASFDFVIRTGATVLYSLSGSVDYLFDPVSGQKSFVTNLDAAAGALNGFALSSPEGSDDEYGFVWDATPISVLFPEGSLLQPGEEGFITYETRVVSYSFATCTEQLTGVCLNAYSGFGDPIGAGTSDPDLELLRVQAAMDDGAEELAFDEFRFALPTFERGVLSYQPILEDSVVPEPATWAMLIVGFGMIGAAVRRRERARATA